MSLALDASLTLSWFFKDERTPGADAVQGVRLPFGACLHLRASSEPKLNRPGAANTAVEVSEVPFFQVRLHEGDWSGASDISNAQIWTS